MSDILPIPHRRRSIRLPRYDYTTPGAYFVTICTWNRACVLGDIANDEMDLSVAGQVTQDVWEELPDHYPHVRLDAWVIMPNHVHGIIVLTDTDVLTRAPNTGVGAGLKPAPTDGNAGDIRVEAGSVGAGSVEAGSVGVDLVEAGLVEAGLVGAGFKPAPTDRNTVHHGLPEIVRAFKTFSARRINALHGTAGAPFWQRNYYEHIVRDEAELNRIRQYIMDNPARWHEDPDNPEAPRPSTEKRDGRS